jgi:hypothetical protein
MAMKMATPVLVLLLAVAANLACAGAQAPEPAVMLRAGTWDGGVGTYHLPASFENLEPSSWPIDGWYRLSVRPDRIESARLVVPDRQMPPFLRSIASQVERPESQPEPAQDEQVENVLYVRVPGLRLREGSVSLYKFKNGTASLRPMLDHKYELSLGTFAFAVTVRNGLRGKNGAPYGDGAQYTVEYDGNRYEYSLGEFGWDSTITAIADLDGDGKPDFLIAVGGNNSSSEYVLLSSKAKPGRNPPTASLHSTGC